MTNDSEPCVLDIEWDATARADLPSLVGPFDTRSEATEWADRNVPNGHARVRALGYPYLRARVS